MTRDWEFSLFFVCLIPIVLVACNLDSGPPRAPVTGIVTYRGIPVAKAQISFIPTSGDPQIATGMTDEQGKFSLTTMDLNDGAIVGSHKVQIMAHGPDRPLKPGEIGSGLPGEMVRGDPAIPTKYFDAQTSGLTFDVKKPGPNEAKFELVD
jgi:hypothetical protein